MISIIIKKNIIDFKNIVFKDTEWVFKTIFVFSHNFEYNFPSFYLKIKEFYLKSNINCFGQGLGFLDSSFFKRN